MKKIDISGTNGGTSSAIAQSKINGTTAAADEDGEYETDDSTAFSISDKLPSSNNAIRGQKDVYAVGRKIAPGKFGAIYEVLRRRDGKPFAAKLEVCDVNTNALNNDYLVLKDANKANCSHICTLIDKGKIEGHFKFVVMTRLGENLYKLRMQFQQHRFSAPTSLRLSLDMLNALQQLHSLGFVHRDVKPSNFCIHEEGGQTKVYLVDFGLSRQFRSPNGEFKPPREKTHFRGTPRYASIAAHRGNEQAPKDDIESWIYVVIEFMSGELPWSVYRHTQQDLILKMKDDVRKFTEMQSQLLKFCPRTEFRRIFNYLDGLHYSTIPDYLFIQQMIQLAMKNNDIQPNEPYDWQVPDVDTD